MRRCSAPVNAPRSCPKSSLSTSPAAIAPQFSLIMARSRRGLSVWMALATSSFPVPVSPVSRIVESVAATSRTVSSNSRRVVSRPTISSKPATARRGRTDKEECDRDDGSPRDSVAQTLHLRTRR